jgi:hypothetical protein
MIMSARKRIEHWRGWICASVSEMAPSAAFAAILSRAAFDLGRSRPFGRERGGQFVEGTGGQSLRAPGGAACLGPGTWAGARRAYAKNSAPDGSTEAGSAA